MTVLVLGVMVPAVATTSTVNIKDKFTSIGWGGSDGSRHWSRSWEENGDDGDDKEGNVRVVSSGNCASGNCMWISSPLTTLLSGPIGATRRADTSDLEDLELCFDIKSVGALLNSTLQVDVRAEDGWVTVKTYQLSSPVNEHPTIDIGDFRSEDFRVRFRLSAPLLGATEVFIDNIEITGNIEDTSTTSTTQPPATTSTTQPPTTSTTRPAATTTTIKPAATTTTSEPRTPTSDGDSTTTTTVTVTSTEPGTVTTSDQGESSTTTTIALVGSDDSGGGGPGGGGPGDGGRGDGGDPGSAIAPPGSGIRAAARGLQASFQGDLYGDVRTVSALGGVDLQADYNMAVEVIRASWAWMALLALVIAWALVTGLDRRRDTLEFN